MGMNLSMARAGVHTEHEWHPLSFVSHIPQQAQPIITYWGQHHPRWDYAMDMHAQSAGDIPRIYPLPRCSRRESRDSGRPHTPDTAATDKPPFQL